MKEYFDMNEKQDLQQLYEFNAEKHLFDSIKPSEEKAQIDATAKHKNREFAVEIKHNYQKVIYNCCMFLSALCDRTAKVQNFPDVTIRLS